VTRFYFCEFRGKEFSTPTENVVLTATRLCHAYRLSSGR
jgi:hypothetical protein